METWLKDSFLYFEARSQRHKATKLAPMPLKRLSKILQIVSPGVVGHKTSGHEFAACFYQRTLGVISLSILVGHRGTGRVWYTITFSCKPIKIGKFRSYEWDGRVR